MLPSMASLLTTLRSGIHSGFRSLFGASPPAPTPPHERTREQVSAGQPGMYQPQLLPYVDDPTGESAAARAAYRKMLAEPFVKAPLFSKIFAVAAGELNFAPAVEDDPRAQLHADFCRWQFTERLAGGVPLLAWSIFSGGLIDGYSVSHKARAVQVGGKWHGKHILREVKAKRVGDDVVLVTDEYQNVVGLQGQRYNSGEVFHPDDFLIWRNPGLYGSPTGMSDLRAAYRAYWCQDSAIKLRMIGAEKRALPLIVGQYKDSTQKPSLEAALELAKSSHWLSAPVEAQIQALNIAGTSESYFRDLIKDLREEIVLAVAGALLQQLQGAVGAERGDSQVHKDTSDLLKWWLQAALLEVLNGHEGGLIRDVIDPNFANVGEYPRATVGGIDERELAESLRIDQGLSQIGWKLSRKDLARRYGRAWATGPDDEVQAPAPGGLPPGSPGLPFAEPDTLMTNAEPGVSDSPPFRFAEGWGADTFQWSED